MPLTKSLNFADFVKNSLTYERKQRFWAGIDGANNRLRMTMVNYAHGYEGLSKRGKTFDTREWGISFFNDAFSTDEGAKRRIIKNVDGFEIDNQYFLYFGLITDPYEPPLEPRIIQKAKETSQQLLQPMLSPIFNTPISNPKEIPLQELFPILVGYI